MPQNWFVLWHMPEQTQQQYFAAANFHFGCVLFTFIRCRCVNKWCMKMFFLIQENIGTTHLFLALNREVCQWQFTFESQSFLHCLPPNICECAGRQHHPSKTATSSPGWSLGQDWLLHQQQIYTDLLWCLCTGKARAWLHWSEKKSSQPCLHLLLNTVTEIGRFELKISKLVKHTRRNRWFSAKRRVKAF